MDLGPILDNLKAEYGVVTGAPVYFIMTAIVMAAIMWRVFYLRYQHRFDNLRSSLDFADRQVADYKDKLSGETPDEARARIDALESAMAKLQRRLTQEQKEIIARRVSAHPGQIVVKAALSARDGGLFMRDFESVFRQAGWVVDKWATAFSPRNASTGIVLWVTDTTQLSRPEQVIIDALNDAKIQYELQGGYGASEGLASIMLFITTDPS